MSEVHTVSGSCTVETLCVREFQVLAKVRADTLGDLPRREVPPRRRDETPASRSAPSSLEDMLSRRRVEFFRLLPGQSVNSVFEILATRHSTSPARPGRSFRLRRNLIFSIPVFIFIVFILFVKLRVIAHFFFFLFRNLPLEILDVLK